MMVMSMMRIRLFAHMHLTMHEDRDWYGCSEGGAADTGYVGCSSSSSNDGVCNDGGIASW
ncbi:MAG: hypothetical protein QW560_06365 [Candidatus Nitrosocaldus sp.]